MKNFPKFGFWVLSAGLFLLTFFSFGGIGWGKSTPAIDFRFEKVGWVPIDDRSGGSLGPELDRLFLLNIEESLRFNLKISRLASQPFPLNSRKIKNISRTHGLDGLIVSYAEAAGDKIRLGVSLSSGASGKVFAREFVSFKKKQTPGAMNRAVNSLVQKLLSRLPYNGWVLEVGEGGRWVKVNSGLFHGLGKGVIVDLFSLSGIKRSPLTGEFIGAQEEKIGSLKIVEVGPLTATAKIVNLEKGRMISGGEFFRFKPSKKILDSVREEKLVVMEKQRIEEPIDRQISKPVKPAKRPKTKENISYSKGSLSLYAGPSWSRYNLNSSPLNLDRETSAFPRIKTEGEYWFLSWFGAGGNLSQGAIKFDKVDSVSVDESARVFSYALYLNFRLAGWEGNNPGTGFFVRAGFQNLQYKFSTTDTQFLTDARYSGPLLGVEIRLPIKPSLKTNIGLNYFPAVKVKESPVSSGEDPSSVGAELYLEGRFRLTERLWFSTRYEYLGYFTDYSGTGDRAGGMTGASTKDLLHSFLFGLSLEF